MTYKSRLSFNGLLASLPVLDYGKGAAPQVTWHLTRHGGGDDLNRKMPESTCDTWLIRK
jgi:hypothetical protein